MLAVDQRRMRGRRRVDPGSGLLGIEVEGETVTTLRPRGSSSSWSAPGRSAEQPHHDAQATSNTLRPCIASRLKGLPSGSSICGTVAVSAGPPLWARAPRQRRRRRQRAPCPAARQRTQRRASRHCRRCPGTGTQVHRPCTCPLALQPSRWRLQRRLRSGRGSRAASAHCSVSGRPRRSRAVPQRVRRKGSRNHIESRGARWASC